VLLYRRFFDMFIVGTHGRARTALPFAWRGYVLLVTSNGMLSYST
jgi:hypothetical protein